MRCNLSIQVFVSALNGFYSFRLLIILYWSILKIVFIIKIEIVLFIDTKTELISHSTNALRVEWLSNINLKNPLPIVLFILAHTFLWNLRHVWIAICQRFLIFVSTQWFCIQNRLNWNDNFKLTELWGLQSQSIYSNIPPTLLIILKFFNIETFRIQNLENHTQPVF